MICKNLYQLSLFNGQHCSYMKLVNKFPSHRGRSISSPPVKSTSIHVIPGSGRSFSSPDRIETNVMGMEWKFFQHILKRKRAMLWLGMRSDNTHLALLSSNKQFEDSIRCEARLSKINWQS